MESLIETRFPRHALADGLGHARLPGDLPSRRAAPSARDVFAASRRARSWTPRAPRLTLIAGRIGSVFSAALVVLGCIAAMVPFAPEFPHDGIRAAWAFALNAAVAKGLVFGRDIDFTFGPFAAVYTRQYHPATDTLMLWASGLIAIAFAAGLIRLSSDRFKLTAILLALFLPLLELNRDAMFFGPPIILLLLACRIALPANHPDRLAASPITFATLALTVVALSLLPLVKVTFAAASGLALALSWLILMLRGQRIAAMAGAALVFCAVPLFWVLGHQPLSELPRFIMDRPRIISGYNDAMSLQGSAWQPILVAAGCVLLGVAHARRLWSGRLAGATLAAGLLILLFFAFKAGFVRQELFHVLIAPGTLALAAWIMMVALPGNGAMLGLIASLTVWAAIDRGYTGLTTATASARITAALLDSADGLAARLGGTAYPKTQYADSLKAIRDRQHLPAMTGRTDVYSNAQDVLLAYDLDWSPRPVFQSYSAYAPELLEENARHLVGDQAPDNILFAVEPVDGRLPSLEDGLSWPTLLTRYQPTDLFGGMAVLRRLPTPTLLQPIGEKPIASGVYRLGEPIPLPDTTRDVWAKIETAPSLAGKLIAAAWKMPPLAIRFQLPGGHEQQYRFIAGMGRTGFVASPLVRNTSDFLALALPDAAAYSAGRRPLSFVVAAEDGPPGMWENAVSVRFYPLDVPAQPIVEHLFDGPQP